MRKLLIPLTVAAALATLLATPREARADWPRHLPELHAQTLSYSSFYLPWWYGYYPLAYTYSYATLPWWYGYYYYYYVNPVYYSPPWWYIGRPYPWFYRPWFWGGAPHWHHHHRR